MKTTDYKTQVIDEIMSIENEKTLKKLYTVVHTFLADYREDKKGKKPEKPSFEQWNKQFTDNQSLDDFIPEYGMTLREFRKDIYDAEMSDYNMTTEEFQESIKTW